MRVPIVVYADFDSFTKQIDSCQPILTEALRKLTKSMNRLDSALTLFVMGKSRDLSCIQNKQNVKTWPKSL